MKRLFVPILAALSLVATGLLVTPSAGAAPPDHAGPGVYVGELTSGQFEKLQSLGLGRSAITAAGKEARQDDRVAVEVVMSKAQAEKLRARGFDFRAKRVDGETARERMRTQAEEGYDVFRPYSGSDGIREELVRTARDHPELAETVKAGETVQGKDILAVRITKGARKTPDGKRPAVLYSGAQHAREWITPEMVTRLMHHYLDNYGSDREITRIVNKTELWFLPVANPDGYDHTFTPGNRLWRKNLRDNDGDGEITNADGVDLNRNWPHRWGYDNEGSSPNPASQVYRGAEPASEPETRALDSLFQRADFEHQVNYHSAAELLLYGVGWQVATPTPDDLVYEAMAGTDENPAIPGYDPDISAELYTTNGETTEHVHNEYGTLAFTPEMSTCATASRYDPDDEFDPGDCVSVFNFPDSEKLVQREFEKNIPFALSVAKSAHDPDDPVSSVGRDAPALEVDEFNVSYGSPQPVAVTAKRSLPVLRMHYRINGGRVQRTEVREWSGGERYGDESDTYYGEFRGTVRGAEAGDRVEVWFSGVERGSGRVESEHFTYRVERDSDAAALVLANENYQGVSPEYPQDVTAPKYAGDYVDALAANDIESEVWDVTEQGVPHHLGVLSHFDAVLWYKGDNQLTQDPEDEVTETFIGPFEDAAVAEREQYVTMAVRDYLNEGGKVAYTGETTADYGTLGTSIGGIYYGLDGAPEEDCVVSADFFSDCLFVADDFTQYYMGAWNRSTVTDPQGVAGTAGPLDGAEASFGGPAVEDNPLDEAGVFVPTSEVLDEERFPQFASSGAAQYVSEGGAGPFSPAEGEWYAGSLHANDSYMRLTRTIDLSGVAADENPRLAFQLSHDLEQGYDNVIVEAHTAGEDDWTTLPDLNGGTDSEVPTECAAGFYLDLHPWLERYLTPGDPCEAGGSTGEWHRFTGSSDGWQEAAFDLSRYAGEEVEVSISYATDPATGGIGVFVDDTRVTVGGEPVSTEGFESGLGEWSVPGSPPGSAPNADDFDRSQGFVASAVTTEDTVLLGFGLEQVADAEARADLVGRIMSYLR